MKSAPLLNRRRFLGLGVTGFVGTVLLSACASGSAPATSSTSQPASASASPSAAKSTVTAQPAVTPATSANASGEKVTLTYWSGWSGLDLKLQSSTMMDPFNKANPNIEAKIETVAGQYQKVLTSIAAGTPPDVVSAVWLNQLSAMAVRNGLTDLTDYFKQSKLNSDVYFPNYWDQWHYNGKLWGLAITTSTNMYVYNATTAKEVGLDPEKPPKTISDLDMWADKMTVLDSSGNLKRLGFRPSGLWFWGYVFGAQFYDEKTQKITANDPKMVSALDWIASYGKKWGGIKKIEGFESGYGSFGQPSNPFLTGIEASMITGEYLILYVKDYKPEMDSETRYAPAPFPEGGRDNATTFGGSIFTIPKGVKHPDASWEFVRFIQDPNIGGAFAISIYNLQPVKSDFKDKRYSDSRIQLGLKIESGDHAFGVLPIPVNEFYSQKLGEAESAVIHGQNNSKAALDQVTKTVQDELDRVLKGGASQ